MKCYYDNHWKFYYEKEDNDDDFDPFPNCENADEREEAYEDVFSKMFD